ncbi:MAG: GPP34 family phosphoprotein [Gammaproteobacteria bacterium]|nr:GPP34 family phosphoprotein [Gammaproteobacteria bacterium]MYF52442.1 GPP34 family phosphoprotein [Gammaproteobacteria bacterium]MYK43139.1 GPP34 family phosphoprotein [Gammaproteobacteria bacterium]
MQSSRLTIAEEIILLQLCDEGGAFIHVPNWTNRYAMSGAILMEFAEAGRIDTDLKQLTVINREPLNHPLANNILDTIESEKEIRDIRYWIEYLSDRSDEIRQDALDGLIGKGILECRDSRILWVFKSRKYPILDGKQEREVKLRLMEVLFSDAIPSPRDVILLCLAHATGILNVLLPANELVKLADRVEDIRQLDLIGQSVVNAIRDIEVSLAISTAPLF